MSAAPHKRSDKEERSASNLDGIISNRDAAPATAGPTRTCPLCGPETNWRFCPLRSVTVKGSWNLSSSKPGQIHWLLTCGTSFFEFVMIICEIISHLLCSPLLLRAVGGGSSGVNSWRNRARQGPPLGLRRGSKAMKGRRKTRRETWIVPSAAINWHTPSMWRFGVNKASPLPLPSPLNAPLLSALLYFSGLLSELHLHFLLLPGTVWKFLLRTLGLVRLLGTGSEGKWSGPLCLAANHFRVIPAVARKKRPRKMTEQQRPGVTRLLVWCKGSVTTGPAYLEERNLKKRQSKHWFRLMRDLEWCRQQQQSSAPSSIHSLLFCSIVDCRCNKCCHDAATEFLILLCSTCTLPGQSEIPQATKE